MTIRPIVFFTSMKLATSMIFGSAAALSCSLLGYSLALSPNTTMSFGIMIIGLSFVNLYPLLKNAIIIFLVSLVLLVMSTLFKDYTQEFLMCSLFFASLITFFEWNKAK